jgi:hypothetical protein
LSHKRLRFILVLFMLILVIAAVQLSCSLPMQEAADNPTLTAMSESILRTATAVKEDDSSSNELATAQAEATQSSQEISTTQTAQAASRDEAKLATATISAPILAELPFYGLSADSGHPGWVHDPLTLEIEGYHSYDVGNDYMGTPAKDFVLAADITWDTQYGSSGCGFMFRSDGNQNKPNQYMVIATRFANGRVIFSALVDGEIANVQDFYPKDQDNSFQWQNQTTNRLTVVARGNIIEIYTNNVKIGEVDTTQPPKKPAAPPRPELPSDQTDKKAMNQYRQQLKEYEDILQQSQLNYQSALNNYETRPAVFDEGFLAMIALSESGRTVCQFDKAWLWMLDELPATAAP